MKMNARIGIAAIAVLMGLASCGDDKKFEIEGEIEGKPTMNLYLKYYGNDAVMAGVTPVREGKFDFSASTPRATLLEVSDNERRVMGYAFVGNGDKVTMRLERGNPFKMKVSGTPVNDEWSKALTAFGDSALTMPHDKRNALIEEYIAKNSESVVGALLFATAYDGSIDPVRADSVLQSISVEAKPAYLLDGYLTAAVRYSNPRSLGKVDTIAYRPLVMDTVRYFVPAKNAASLLVFTDDKSNRRDSIVPKLKALRSDMKKLEIVDFMIVPDTSTWRRNVRRDTADWTQAWAPGGLFAKGIDSLAIPRLPYYIVVDTAGSQIYRGPDFPLAKEKAQSLLK